MSQNEIKDFALEVLDVIDELIKPEIKSSLISKFWSFFTGHAKKKILQKPDNEIIEKLLIIQKKLNSRFMDLNTSVEINKMESLGAVKIPNVGELAKINENFRNLAISSDVAREQPKPTAQTLTDSLKFGLTNLQAAIGGTGLLIGIAVVGFILLKK